jgi:hypothetical protein
MKFSALKKLWLAALAFAVIHNLTTLAQVPPVPSYLMPDYNEKGRQLPPGVPRTVDTNGNVIYVDGMFTTQLYREAALGLVLQEANKVAQELKLPEEIPITKSNIVDHHIGPFGFNYAHRSLGFVATKNYCYYVAGGNSFSSLVDTHEQEKCQSYQAKGYAWPVSRIDTNAAYNLAIQWLSDLHMDVAGLNRDCRVSVTADSVYDQAPPGKFIPIYWVAWIPSDGISVATTVRLFMPTKTLLDLTVEDPKYILRKPIQFTNLAALFPGVAPIHTNYPVPMTYIAGPPRPVTKPVLMPNGEVKMVPNN